MIWAKEETMSRAEIEAIQLSRLKDTVNRVYEKVPAYRAKMEEAGVRPEHIQTLKDLQKLPFVTKQDMRDNYPYGLFAVPKKESTHPSVPRESQLWWVIRRMTWRCGRNVWPVWPWQEAPRTRMLPRFVLGMACSPAPWDFTMDWRR